MTRLRLSRPRLRFDLKLAATVVLTIAVGYVAVRILAAGPFVAFEPESASVSGQATAKTIAGASGGRLLAFGNGTFLTPTPAPAAAGGFYGPGIGYDTKANINVGPNGQKVAIRFKASTTSALGSVRWVQRGGPVYSNGNGGTTTLSVQADDGNGHPSGTSLASGSITTGNPGRNWETYTPVFFSSSPTLTAGRIYYIVFTNPSVNNNISVNSVYSYNSTIPRQPRLSDSDFGLMYTTSTWGVIEPGYTPVVDLAYANGTHDGQSYYEAMIANFATITGSAQMARERFTVSGGNKTVNSTSVRVRRTSGSSPLIMTLETSAGSPIESVAVPSAGIPISVPGGDIGGAVWVTAAFASSHLLANGLSYNLRISTAAGTTYTTFPVRAGTDKGFNSYAFTDGTGQFSTNGSIWADLYPYSHEDLQFYFR